MVIMMPKKDFFCKGLFFSQKTIAVLCHVARFVMLIFTIGILTGCGKKGVLPIPKESDYPRVYPPV